MDSLLHIGLSNAVVATLLALVALVVGAVCRRPAVVHGLWLLVLLKLVTPPLVRVPVPWPAPAHPPPASLGYAGDQPDTSAWSRAPAEEAVVGPFLVPGEAIDLALPQEFPIALDALEPAAPAPVPTPEPFAWVEALATVWATGSAGWFLLAGRRVSRFQDLLRL